MRVVALDFETFYSSAKIKYSLKNLIAEEYCRHPLFDCYLMSVCDGAVAWVGHPKDFNWKSLEGATLVSHNSYFDRTVYEELVRRELAPRIQFADWQCSANLCAYLANRRSLAAAAEHLLKVKLDKDPRDNANGKHWEDFSETEKSAMLDYARADAVRCWELWNKFSPQWPEWERKLSNLTIEQGLHGVGINADLLNTYILQTHEMKLSTEKLLPWLESEWDEDDEFNTKPTSTKCVAEQCRRVGIPAPPAVTKEPEEFELWEATYAPAHPWIQALSSWRSINKLVKTFSTMKSRIRPDGTMPFSLRYCGAHTKRWSGEAQLNFQNMRKKPVLKNEAGLMETDEIKIDAALKTRAETGSFPEWVKADVDFRRLIVPRPGKKLVISDLAAIEPRVLAHLCGNTALLDLIAGGMNLYEAYGRSVLGYTGEKVDKNGADYKLWKASILGLGYGAGAPKFLVMAKTLAGIDLSIGDPEWITEENPLTGEVKKVPGYGQNARRIVAEFRSRNPSIPALWKKLDEALHRSIGHDLVLTLPSGNKLTYEKVRAETRMEPHPETKKPRRKTVWTAEIGGRRMITWGSRLVENLVQATARDVLADQMVAIAERGWRILFSAHDELVLEVDNTVSASDVEREMSRTPDWLKPCPIAAVAHEATHYGK